MKSSQLKSLIKECIKEVHNENANTERTERKKLLALGHKYVDKIKAEWIKEHSSLEEENDRTEEQVIDALLELINYSNKLK